jgi:hypothetical protein
LGDGAALNSKTLAPRCEQEIEKQPRQVKMKARVMGNMLALKA